MELSKMNFLVNVFFILLQNIGHMAAKYRIKNFQLKIVFMDSLFDFSMHIICKNLRAQFIVESFSLSFPKK